METITEEDREFTLTHEDGTTETVVGKVITTDHGETDNDGFPKISVEVKVPAADLFAQPGQNG
jgi:hypothetical protein